MSAHFGPARRRRPATAVCVVAAAVALTATACDSGGGESKKASDSPSSQAKQPSRGEKEKSGLPDELPKKLPSSLQDLDKWRNGGWKNWDRDQWLREAKDFVNPIIKNLWNKKRMKDADGNDRKVRDRDIDKSPSGGKNGTGEDEGVTDPTPPKVKAKAVKLPYGKATPPVGKVFMDTPKGAMVCSGTVVKDPRHPGKSNLVATAGHCVHAGKKGGWYRNIVFVPHYNPKGLPNSRLNSVPKKQVAPKGIWWAKYASTTKHWIDNGGEIGGQGASKDFAVLRVQPEDKRAASLEQTVGKAVRVNFKTPRVKAISRLSPYGYPAAPPYDGSRMYSCTDRPRRLSIDPKLPTMYRVGCTMTGGSSGGGWLSPGGTELLSVTSIGPVGGGWLAGARLGPDAERAFTTISKK